MNCLYKFPALFLRIHAIVQSDVNSFELTLAVDFKHVLPASTLQFFYVDFISLLQKDLIKPFNNRRKILHSFSHIFELDLKIQYSAGHSILIIVQFRAFGLAVHALLEFTQVFDPRLVFDDNKNLIDLFLVFEIESVDQPTKVFIRILEFFYFKLDLIRCLVLKLG